MYSRNYSNNYHIKIIMIHFSLDIFKSRHVRMIDLFVRMADLFVHAVNFVLRAVCFFVRVVNLFVYAITKLGLHVACNVCK